MLLALLVAADLDLDEWKQYKYYKHPTALVPPPPGRSIDRIHIKDYSVERFNEQYGKPKKPVIIQGIVDQWPAAKEWYFQNLYDELRHRKFKCGEDDDGYAVKMKLKYFLRYMEHQRDDSPMYIFDSTFDEDKRAKTLLSSYSVPEYFNEDLFRLVGESRRPPYRWFLIGPKRSGTSPHTDPLATSAWNALVVGRKR